MRYIHNYLDYIKMVWPQSQDVACTHFHIVFFKFTFAWIIDMLRRRLSPFSYTNGHMAVDRVGNVNE